MYANLHYGSVKTFSMEGLHTNVDHSDEYVRGPCKGRALGTAAQMSRLAFMLESGLCSANQAFSLTKL